MNKFPADDLLLESETARKLFFDCAAGLPIVDYHSHVSPEDIFEDRRYDDIGMLWFGGLDDDGKCTGDHYKWRLMRADGMDESIVTGKDSGRARFRGFARMLEKAAGNPMYHWCHLELSRYFGIDEILCEKSADRIYDLCNEKLKSESGLSVRGIIRKSNVKFIGTTDDPTDQLIWHKKIANDPEAGFKVCPTFRPDRALDIESSGFASYIEKLSDSSKTSIHSADDVTLALLKRLDHFMSCGCLASDHGLLYIPFLPAPEKVRNEAFKKAVAGIRPDPEEAEAYRTGLLLDLARAYKKHDIVMQLHYSVKRDVNSRMFSMLGPNSGHDMMIHAHSIEKLACFFSELEKTCELPKTIIFSLNPSDNEQIATLAGCFQSGPVPGKIQHGPAWWFNDNRTGIRAQLISYAEQGILGNFVGMLTDSRSFLSYTRHEYFRRILCDLLGGWVERGEYPDDRKALERLVKDISYRNALRYFRIGEEKDLLWK